MKNPIHGNNLTDWVWRRWAALKDWLHGMWPRRGIRPHPPLDHDGGERRAQRMMERRRNLHA